MRVTQWMAAGRSVAVRRRDAGDHVVDRRVVGVVDDELDRAPQRGPAAPRRRPARARRSRSPAGAVRPVRTASASGREVGDRSIRRRVGDSRDAPGGQARAEAGEVGRRGLGEKGPEQRVAAVDAPRRPIRRVPLDLGNRELVETDRVDAGPVERPAGPGAILHADRAAGPRSGRARRGRGRRPPTRGSPWPGATRPAGGARSASRSARAKPARSTHSRGPTRTDAASAAVASRWTWWSCRPGSSGAAVGVDAPASSAGARGRRRPRRSRRPATRTSTGGPRPATSAPADQEVGRSRRPARRAPRRCARPAPAPAGRPGGPGAARADDARGNRQRWGRPSSRRPPTSRRRAATDRRRTSASSAATARDQAGQRVGDGVGAEGRAARRRRPRARRPPRRRRRSRPSPHPARPARGR